MTRYYERFSSPDDSSNGLRASGGPANVPAQDTVGHVQWEVRQVPSTISRDFVDAMWEMPMEHVQPVTFKELGSVAVYNSIPPEYI